MSDDTRQRGEEIVYERIVDTSEALARVPATEMAEALGADRIDVSVDTQLGRVGQQMKAFAYALVPRCPQCVRNDNVRLVADASHAEAPRDVWECSACARTFTEANRS